MAVDFIQANTNGRLHDAREASITPLNRGFLYGDAIYEVWRTYAGVLFAWQEHWLRLEQSAAALSMCLPATADHLLEEIKRTAAAFRGATDYRGELYVRLQVTRGGGPIGLDPGRADRPDYVLLVQANRGLTREKLAEGFRLSLATGLHRNHPASLNPAWKTGNYLNNILCLHEARGRGADEVVITNLAGEVTEAAVANLGFVCDGDIHTPPLSAGMLAGITRGLVLEHVAPAAGIRVHETTLRPEDFARMQECFLLSTTKDVAPVGCIDAHRFRVAPDTITMRLKAAFADYVRAYIARHPEQSLG